MATDETQFIRTPLEELGGTQADVLMRCAVEPVATHPLLFVKLIGQALQSDGDT